MRVLYSLTCIILLSVFNMVNCRVLPRRIRHSSHRNAEPEVSSEDVLAQLQADILSDLGMSSQPNDASLRVPNYARQIALEDVEDDGSSDSQHFMEKSSNLLLIAKKVQTDLYGETIQFNVNAADRETAMTDVKLYYYINTPNITMTTDNDIEKLRYRLNLLRENADGSISSHLIENFEIHRHLIGWHSQQIPSNLTSSLVNDERIPADANVTINFQLTCLNCIYQAFPSSMSKDTIPFLKVSARRRRTRRNGLNQCSGGRCCPRELIVDFEAMGWDWVLHPKRYTANYCGGTCTALPRDRVTMSSQNHIINAMLRYMRSGRTSSCCVPSSEEPLHLMFTDQSGVIRSSRSTIRTITGCRCT